MQNFIERHRPLYEADGAAGGGAAGGGAAGGGAAGAGSGAGAGGAAAHSGSWYSDPASKIPEPVQKWADGHKFTDVTAALNYGMQSEKLARDRNVIERWDPAKPQEWKGWQEFGWTEDEGKYAASIKAPEVKDGQVFSKQMFEAAVKSAHKLRLPPSAVQSMYGDVFTAMNEMAANAAAEEKTRISGQEKALSDALDKEWGNKRGEKTALAERAFRALKIQPLEGKQIEDVIGAPGMLKVMAALGEALGEDRLTDVLHGAGNGGRTAATIEQELNKLETDPATLAILNDQRHPRHNEIVQARRKLIGDLAASKSRAA